MSPQVYHGALLVHCAVTWYMVGLIWFVQVVHYPLFAEVGDQASAAYQRAHMRKTTWVTLPPMLVEALLVVLLVLPLGGQWPGWVELTGAVFLAVIWLSTFLIQVPCHEKLALSFQPQIHRWLVASNWIRTLGWTGRGVLALLLLPL